ncbi:FAD-binding oxidoreductase [Variovorax sp. E3]|uniref:NAD(P)/FAD-dependent oxidoreductase n=1 Tax=Variovorax sp. E3 TaxID=1914993 RepID=UPI0018DE4B4C|nr:FAD-binding oxidoreductase [Variovorax sp. E3]
MAQEILVLGAGMVGACTALELTLRGHAVTLVDRQPAGRETSYGNAGVIQREAVEPYAFPRDLRAILCAAFGRTLDVRYQMTGLMAALPQLVRYWRNSAPRRHRRISQEYAGLIAHSTSEHAGYIALAEAGDLVRREGLRLMYRSEQALQAALTQAQRLRTEYGIAFDMLDTRALASAEPAFLVPLAGAIHWLESWSVSDPGALVERYASAFLQRGGRMAMGDAGSLRECAGGWEVATAGGAVKARHAVVALGPWAGALTRRMGYRVPLFVKRGYHRHYVGGGSVAVPTLDAERGYVMSPQRRGLRITTGAEIARIDAKPTSRQLAGAEAEARTLLKLGEPVEAQPWLGCRPCCADMKPVIGPAQRHKRLWFNFGHGHHGFTLGPASARLLADLIEGRKPYTAAQAFSPERFPC